MHRPTQAVRLSTYATLAAGTAMAGATAEGADFYEVVDYYLPYGQSGSTVLLDASSLNSQFQFGFTATAATTGTQIRAINNNVRFSTASNFSFGNEAVRRDSGFDFGTLSSGATDNQLFIRFGFGGQWQTVGSTGFLGFAFIDGSDRYYGWIEMTTEPRDYYGQARGAIRINSWFINGTANETVIAGQTGGGGAVPGLGGLAALACGAAGMRRSRNRVA
jgi:hypothetical protein